MKSSQKLLLSNALIACTLTPVSSYAVDVYSVINMSRQNITEESSSYSSIRSNGSAIGVSEERALNHGVSAEFLLEYEIEPDQPVTGAGGASEGGPFALSAGYVGLAGRVGKLKIGYFATPLNILGDGVDHFADLRGDKGRYISTGDVDISDAVMYTSPEWQGLTARISHVSYEDEDANRSDGASVSVSYEHGKLFTGLAYDTEVEGDDIDLLRAVVRYPVGNIALGAIWERRDAIADDGATTGWLVSANIPVDDVLSFQVQHGQSDNRAENGKSTSGGATYVLGEGVNLYVFATSNTSEDPELGDESEYGLGISYTF